MYAEFTRPAAMLKLFRRNPHSGPDLQAIVPRVGMGPRRSFWHRVVRRAKLAALVAMVLPWLLIGVMRWVDPFYSAFMLVTRAERTLNKVPQRNIRYQWVDYADITPAMRLAVIAAEDQHFAGHNGFDWQAIDKARNHNLRSRRVRGASTISQQVAKNLFLWRGRSWLRKGIEMYLTLIIETLWPKQRILEVYLNIAQFGDRYFGVGAASHYLLKTTPDQLSASQAALLAAVLPAPARYNAAKPSAYVRHRQGWIMQQMRRLGPQHLQSIEE